MYKNCVCTHEQRASCVVTAALTAFLLLRSSVVCSHIHMHRSLMTSRSLLIPISVSLSVSRSQTQLRRYRWLCAHIYYYPIRIHICEHRTVSRHSVVSFSDHSGTHNNYNSSTLSFSSLSLALRMFVCALSCTQRRNKRTERTIHTIFQVDWLMLVNWIFSQVKTGTGVRHEILYRRRFCGPFASPNHILL